MGSGVQDGGVVAKGVGQGWHIMRFRGRMKEAPLRKQMIHDNHITE